MLKIMNIVVKCIIYGLFLMMIFSNVSYANELEKHKINSFLPDTKQQTETFPDFINKFVTAIDNNNWQALSKITKFPFTFRGQLDFEGGVKVSEAEFIKIFPKFLELEAFTEIDGENISTTYRVLSKIPVDTSKDIKGNRAEINDFVFAKYGNHWQFIQVYTDLSNISLIKE